jgi:hypothetical protein
LAVIIRAIKLATTVTIDLMLPHKALAIITVRSFTSTLAMEEGIIILLLLYWCWLSPIPGWSSGI